MLLKRRAFSTLPVFKLERYFAKYEHLPNLTHLCASDTESITVRDALRNYADQDVRTRWIEMDLNYTEVKGHPVLLDELATMYNNTSTTTKPLQSQLHFQELAPQEGILLGSLALDLNVSKRIVVMSPGYQSLHQIATESGAQVSHWTPRYDNDTGATKFHVDDLQRLTSKSIEPITAIVVNFPHNPTGTLPTSNEWNDIIDIAKENDAYLFADEMYHGLEMNSENRLTPAVVAYPEKGISLSGLSKTYGMPGARIGWIACHDEQYIHRIASLRDWTTICSSAPSQLLGILAIRAKEKLQARARKYIQQGKDSVKKVMEDDKISKLLTWSDMKNETTNAGPMGWIKCNDGVSSEEYCDVLVKTSGLLLLPSNVYDFGGTLFFKTQKRKGTVFVSMRSYTWYTFLCVLYIVFKICCF